MLDSRFGVCVFAAFVKLFPTFKELSLKAIHPWSNTNYHHSYMLCCMVINVKITRFIIHTGFSFFLIFYLSPSIFAININFPLVSIFSYLNYCTFCSKIYVAKNILWKNYNNLQMMPKICSNLATDGKGWEFVGQK